MEQGSHLLLSFFLMAVDEGTDVSDIQVVDQNMNVIGVCGVGASERINYNRIFSSDHSFEQIRYRLEKGNE